MNSPRYEKAVIPLEKIVKLHDSIDGLSENLSTPPLALPAFQHLPEGSLESILTVFPIQVKPFSKGFSCVGNVRLFKLCCAFLPSSQAVPVEIIKARLSSEDLKMQYLSELIQCHIIYTLDPKDIKTIYSLLQGERDRVLNDPLFGSRAEFAQALGVSEGWLSK